jgi:uncharacterized protein YjfI (DUF2170 family)
MTLLESRPKSNICDPNDFNKFKIQAQRLEPIQSFWKNTKAQAQKLKEYMVLFLNESLSPMLDFHMILLN